MSVASCRRSQELQNQSQGVHVPSYKPVAEASLNAPMLDTSNLVRPAPKKDTVGAGSQNV